MRWLRGRHDAVIITISIIFISLHKLMALPVLKKTGADPMQNKKLMPLLQYWLLCAVCPGIYSLFICYITYGHALNVIMKAEQGHELYSFLLYILEHRGEENELNRPPPQYLT